MLKNKINNPRLILAKLRKGDDVHAGEKEAIDIVLNKINSLVNNVQSKKLLDHFENKKVLDVGCGLGGTTEYVRQKTSHDIYGINIDEFFIKHTKKYFPNVNLFQCDVQNVGNLFNKNKFDESSLY